MNKKLVYVGLDVDDTQYHGSALSKATGELFSFRCRPTLKGLLERTVAAQSGSLRVNLQLLCRQLQALNQILKDYRQQIEDLAQTERYAKPVKALTCYKGIKTIFALTMITEIGDIQRFPHPRQLVSWIGMDSREYSSGGKHNRFGITKHGNRYLRTAFVEATQRGFRTTRLSAKIRARQARSAPEYVDIANRCSRRLSKKGNRLLSAGKHPNKVKVACARDVRIKTPKHSMLATTVPTPRVRLSSSTNTQ